MWRKKQVVLSADGTLEPMGTLFGELDRIAAAAVPSLASEECSSATETGDNIHDDAAAAAPAVGAPVPASSLEAIDHTNTDEQTCGEQTKLGPACHNGQRKAHNLIVDHSIMTVEGNEMDVAAAKEAAREVWRKGYAVGWDEQRIRHFGVQCDECRKLGTACKQHEQKPERGEKTASKPTPVWNASPWWSRPPGDYGLIQVQERTKVDSS